jgi:hypothetical protein
MREFLRTEVSQIGMVEILSFSFLEAYNITVAFIDILQTAYVAGSGL